MYQGNRFVEGKEVRKFHDWCVKSRQELEHPNIIRYLESFVEGNYLIIVLELADAGDLGKMIKHFKSQGKIMPERTIWK